MRLLSLAAAAFAGFLGTAEAVWPSDVKLYGINYDMQNCRTADQERGDLENIAKISKSVRIYGLSMNKNCPVTRLLDTCKQLGLKVAMGMWLDDKTNFQTQLKGLDDVLRTGKVDNNVVGFHVGSEAIYRKDHTAAQAIYYLEETRKLFKTRGINMKLTIADVVDVYYTNPGLLDAVDYVSINQFSFWERVDPATGMNKMLDRIRSIRQQAAKAGKEVIISETGWPSDGESTGGGEPSLANQRTFFQDFYHQMSAHNIPYYWFVAYDALWYTWANHTVEMHFGVMTPRLDDRVPRSEWYKLKPSYQNVDFTPRTITTIQSSRGLLAEYMNKDNIEHVKGIEIMNETTDKLEQFRYQWFWDAAKLQFRSVNSDRCLDAYVDKGEYIVHTYTCYEGNPNQQWRYNDETQMMEHVSHKGYCLEDADTVQLAKCNAKNANQRWGIGMAPGRTCSKIEDGLDFIGNDVGSKRSRDAGGCCAHCASFKGCNAFTWTNHDGGTCWLKSGRGSTAFKAGARSAAISSITPTPTTPAPTTPAPTTPAPTTPAPTTPAPTTPAPTTPAPTTPAPTTPAPTTPAPTTPKPTTPAPSMCSIEDDVDYTGTDIGNARAARAEACCKICQDTRGCKAFSWNNYEGGTCWLKSGKGTATRKAGVRSAVVNSDVTPTPTTPTPTTPTPTTPAPGSCPPIENNIDYVGNDVGNDRSNTAEGCCSLCAKRSGCKAFSWNDYMGGTCWFKSGKGAFISKPGTRSAVMPSAPTCSKIEEGFDYTGADVGNERADTAEKCCNICRESKKGCKAYTWTNYNGGTCWLKSAKGSAVAKAGARSATVL